MRRQAFRPVFSGALEDRSSPSALAAPVAEPVSFSIRQVNQVTDRVQIAFSVFGRFRQISQVRDDVGLDVAPIPFSRVDGLQESVDRILDQMEEQLAHRTPGAIGAARREVVVAIRASVANRVRAGDVVLH